MAARLQISEWLEQDPAGELDTAPPGDEPRPHPEPSASSTPASGPDTGPAPVDLDTLRRRLTTGRELARRRSESDRSQPLTTALPALDRLLEGGLVRGELVEIVGGRSSGRFSLVLAVLASVTGAGETAALVDLGDSLHPADAEAAGIELDRLLWLRPRSVREALAGTEILIATGFPLVVVDLGIPPVPGGRGSAGAWVRLARAAERHGTALLVSAPYRVSGTGAATVLTSAGRSLMGSPARSRRPSRRPPLGESPSLLLGLEAELRLEKARARPPGLRERVRLTTPEAARYRTLPEEPSRPHRDRRHAPGPAVRAARSA